MSKDREELIRRIIHTSSLLSSPVRLGIMVYLAMKSKALFTELVEVLGITPGNLNSHLRKLADSGYIKVKKVLADRPRTLIEITDKGLAETMKYVNDLIKMAEKILYARTNNSD